MPVLNLTGNSGAALVDQASAGQKPTHKDNSVRISEIRAQLDYRASIGPHSSKYVVFPDDVHLCFEQTVSTRSHLTNWLARVR
jgi:hypothetical protein